MTFHLMFFHYTFSVWFGLVSGHLLGQSCPFGWPCVLIVLCLFVILVISRFGFGGGVWFLNAPVPVHSLLGTFIRSFSLVLRTDVHLLPTLELDP